MSFADRVEEERRRLAAAQREQREEDEAERVASAAAADQASRALDLRRREQAEAGHHVAERLLENDVEGPAMFEFSVQYDRSFRSASLMMVTERQHRSVAVPYPDRVWRVGSWTTTQQAWYGDDFDLEHPVLLHESGRFITGVGHGRWKPDTLGLPDGIQPLNLGYPPKSVAEYHRPYIEQLVRPLDLLNVQMRTDGLGGPLRLLDHVDEAEDLTAQLATFLARHLADHP